MSKAIAYIDDAGTTCVVHPAPNTGLPLDFVAKLSVPGGKPYKIIDMATDLPKDRLFRGAWEIDPATLTDGVGSDQFGAGSIEEASGQTNAAARKQALGV